MSCASRHIVLLGGTGLLGGAIRRKFRECRSSGTGISLLDSRQAFHEIAHAGTSGLVQRVRESGKFPQDWILASGIVDPKADSDLLLQVNAEIPARLFEILCEHARESADAVPALRFVTFGSVLEIRADIAHSNPYIRSKTQLLRSWKRLSPAPSVPWIHVQLHTLYGGDEPHPFMFLGQMYAALKGRHAFRMSHGTQLREYHHADDIAASLLAVLRDTGNRPEVIDLSSGQPVRLRDLARRVFEHFGASDLLEIGALPTNEAEVYEPCHHPSKYLVACRDPVQGIIDWMESLGVARIGT